MSSGGAKVVHQDYIVKQRYQNTLPPPPGAPKLLKIPFNPMDTYLSPFYLERMRRAEPINIEADAFLGMPIDLVGMPGVFEGDEKGVRPPPPPLSPTKKLFLFSYRFFANLSWMDKLYKHLYILRQYTRATSFCCGR